VNECLKSTLESSVRIQGRKIAVVELFKKGFSLSQIAPQGLVIRHVSPEQPKANRRPEVYLMTGIQSGTEHFRWSSTGQGR
jgi:hypothetical protein